MTDVDVLYSPLESEDFGSSGDDGLEIRQLYANMYVGFILDVGKPGGFYCSAGAGYMQDHISYKQNAEIYYKAVKFALQNNELFCVCDEFD